MKYIAAYMLAVLAGQTPSEKSIKATLASVGATVDDEAVKKVIAELNGKNLEEVIAAGKAKMATVSVSAAPAAAAGGAAAAAAPAADAGKGGKKKEPEPEPEEDGDMGFGLFD
eukprot:c7695_g1_i2.p3 GENE.c7695_g1_i2~~c7695_g1_i2.p3  ORF type:complete len:125 (+),score=39.81 c7695_g1_i2:37-375(+)